jgi:hypothetical protein
MHSGTKYRDRNEAFETFAAAPPPIATTKKITQLEKTNPKKTGMKEGLFAADASIRGGVDGSVIVRSSIEVTGDA